MMLHKLEIYVYDFEGYGVGDVITEIEQNHYFPMMVKDSASITIHDWDDDHELNKKTTSLERFRSYFK